MLGSFNCYGESEDAPFNEEETQETPQKKVQETLDVVYEQIGAVDLDLRVMYPENYLVDSIAPPTFITVGTEDKVLPQYIAKEYRNDMLTLGCRCDLILYPGQEHGFLVTRMEIPISLKLLEEADKFLNSLGYLKGKPIIYEYFGVQSTD